MKRLIFLLTIVACLSGIQVYSKNNQSTQEFSTDDSQSSKITSKNELKIFPNPLTGNKLQVLTTKEIKSVQVYNIVGQKAEIESKVLNPYKREVLFKNRVEGIYLVTIIYLDKTKDVRKIIIR